MSTPKVEYFEPPVYISETDIKAKVQALSEQINQDYGAQEITAVCIIKGSLLFFTDILRHLKMPVVCEFLGVSSYGNQTSSSGEVKVTLDLNEPLEGKHVIVFEDIVDTGLTLSYILDHLRVRKPASIRTATLLFKPDALKAKDLPLDYIGFQIPNKFVVGYGLDYAQKFRGLPYIGYLENEH